MGDYQPLNEPNGRENYVVRICDLSPVPADYILSRGMDRIVGAARALRKDDAGSEGTNMMKTLLRGRKVLIVLDDVNDRKQLEALAGEPDWFKWGSRVIITTRDKQVLSARGVKVVKYADGLPLTIEVLGSMLYDKNKPEWIDTLEKLRTIPLRKTLEKLELSYTSLVDDDYKQIFLDVACLLKGWQIDDAIRALESCTQPKSAFSKFAKVEKEKRSFNRKVPKATIFQELETLDLSVGSKFLTTNSLNYAL
ncbi:Toll/interleukin-1 receptor domain-containing protein [Tanacetum coccineum]